MATLQNVPLPSAPAPRLPPLPPPDSAAHGRLATVRHWGEMIKFSHSIFALPFALLATFLAARDLPGGRPTLLHLALIVLCMVGARSAAMTFNRIVDAEIDRRNPRTRMRQIPRGVISTRAAWLFFVAACGLFFLGCGGFAWQYGNFWPLRLGLPVLAFLCIYSFTKRFTRWSHLVLGLGIAFAPVAAWIALSPATVGPPVWLLMASVAFWIAGFDIIYACQDVDFDRAAGLFSVPAKLGVARALWLARVFHLLTVMGLCAVGEAAGLGWLYFAGVACVVALLVIEHALVSPQDLSRVNLAFFTMNGVVGLVLGALGIIDVLIHRGG